MKYNFDEVIDRSHNRAAKYDERMKKFGREDVIPLWVADMDFRTAEPIIDALKERAEEGIWGYTSRPDSYFEAIRGWQKRRNGWDIKKEMMSWSLGVVPALSSIVKLFSEPGDSIMIQTPVYSEFYDVTEAWGRNVLENRLVEKDGAWGIDFEDFEAKAKEARIFLLCSPHNPLGIVWSREELTRMADICMANNTLLVSDEIHSDLVFHGKKHIPTATLSAETAGRVISCISGTKTFNLAGLQAATLFFPNHEMKDRYEKFWFGMDVHRNNCFSLVAVETAFREGGEWLEQLLDYLEGNIDYTWDYLKKNIPEIHFLKPESTYLLWLDCRELGLSGDELQTFMVQEAGLALNDGRGFGPEGGGYMRMNIACPRATIERALGQLKAAVDRKMGR